MRNDLVKFITSNAAIDPLAQPGKQTCDEMVDKGSLRCADGDLRVSDEGDEVQSPFITLGGSQETVMRDVTEPIKKPLSPR